MMGRMRKTRCGTPGAADRAKGAGRRALRFESIDQMMAEVGRLVEAERAGLLRRAGNWTLGQALNHLAVWAGYSYTGVPLKLPFYVRWFLRLRKRRILYGAMRPGVRVPGVEGGTLATEPVPVDEALERLRRVMNRLKTEAPTIPDTRFGWLTHDEAIAINLRHAELHLGFLVPDCDIPKGS
jgi:hypothetical protein